MSEEKVLRQQVVNILNQQKMVLKNATKRNAEISVTDMMELIHPAKYQEFIGSLDNGDELIQNVKSRAFLGKVLEDSYTSDILRLMSRTSGSLSKNNIQFIFASFSNETYKSFVNSCGAEEMAIIFFLVDRKNQKRILQEMDSYENFFSCSEKQNLAKSLQEIIIENDEDVEIIQKIAECDSCIIARIFEFASAELESKILEFIDVGNYDEICSDVTGVNLYDVLAKSNWKLLLKSRNIEDIIIRISENEKEQVFENLDAEPYSQELFGKMFDNVSLVEQFYLAVNRVNKQKILQDYLNSMLFAELYVRLDLDEKREILEILAGGKHDDFPEYSEEQWMELCHNARKSMENLELDFYEKLVVNELKRQEKK